SGRLGPGLAGPGLAPGPGRVGGRGPGPGFVGPGLCRPRGSKSCPEACGAKVAESESPRQARRSARFRGVTLEAYTLGDLISLDRAGSDGAEELDRSEKN